MSLADCDAKAALLVREYQLAGAECFVIRTTDAKDHRVICKQLGAEIVSGILRRVSDAIFVGPAQVRTVLE